MLMVFVNMKIKDLKFFIVISGEGIVDGKKSIGEIHSFLLQKKRMLPSVVIYL